MAAFRRTSKPFLLSKSRTSYEEYWVLLDAVWGGVKPFGSRGEHAPSKTDDRGG
jgi:hypothetical protein